jgi:hypothetical protein
VTGAHGSPPLGSAAREATAPPYHGKRRAPETACNCEWGFRSCCCADADPPYPGGMDDREERMRDRDPGAGDA